LLTEAHLGHGARKLEKYLTRQFEEHVSRAASSANRSIGLLVWDAIRRRLLKLGAQIHASGFERNELSTVMTVFTGRVSNFVCVVTRENCPTHCQGATPERTPKNPDGVETPVEYEAASAS